ncbi:MAG: hypothetical protein RR214_00680 [Synergistaceae bacterium]
MGLSVHNITLGGTFGDKEVRLCRCVPNIANGIQIILLHGVHSSANFSLHNKFRRLAEILATLGCTSWLVETSRKIRDRHEYADDISSWIRDAFDGKTFAQEQEDAFVAIRHVLEETRNFPHWLWGFSLGGIIALSAASENLFTEGEKKNIFDMLVLSGTGLESYRKVEEQMMKLPILSTLRTTLRADILSSVAARRLLSFRGSCDEIFSEKSCRAIVTSVKIPEDKKEFRSIEGADHSLRIRNGRPDPEIMKEMAAYTVNFGTDYVIE